MQSSCCIEDTSEPCGPFLDLQAENEKLRAKLKRISDLPLSAKHSESDPETRGYNSAIRLARIIASAALRADGETVDGSGDSDE